VQALGAAVAPEEAFLELACGGTAAWIEFTAFLQPGLSEADDDPAKEAQGKGGFGIANPAVIFSEGYVQSVMQAAFDGPIASLEFEQASGIQFFQSQTADEIHDFSGFLALATNSPTELGDGLNSGEAHLLGRSFPAIQHPDFASASVVLPGDGMGLRRGLRGKNAAW
jgi:hypothetical protein